MSISHSPEHISGFHNYAKACGPSVLEHDVNRLRRWALLTGDGFYTYPHYDASGLCTWMQVSTGVKIWSYLRIRNADTDTASSSKQFIKVVNSAGIWNYKTASKKLPTLADLHNLFLTPGTLL